MIVFSIKNDQKQFAQLTFIKNNQEYRKNDVPKAIISLLTAGSMRFRWNETNQNREKVFLHYGINPQNIAPIELIHSKKVFALFQQISEKNVLGDGLITQNSKIIPSVTVADCMPIFLYDFAKKVFGVIHSGWKGTGIIIDALSCAKKNFGSNPADFLVILGPHINECCYAVDEERADFFLTNFSTESVIEKSSNSKKSFFLSLREANLFLLSNAGVKNENIAVCSDCTSCSSLFGSFRRETHNLPKTFSLEERWKHFTPMAACIGYF